jgi:hypothetical protein
MAGHSERGTSGNKYAIISDVAPELSSKMDPRSACRQNTLVGDLLGSPFWLADREGTGSARCILFRGVGSPPALVVIAKTCRQ